MCYYVLRQKRKYHAKESWQPVSLYDNDNHFRGAAIFETEKEVHEYMKIYNDRLQARNEQNLSINPDNRINIQLRICEESEKPKTRFTILSQET